MKKQLDFVTNFHRVFGMGYSITPVNCLGNVKNLLRYNLMKEENDEYLEALNNKDLVGIADALGDMLYVLCGTIVEHGLQNHIEAVFDEIHKSNMSKLDENDKPIYREDGKVLKGSKYFKPNIAKILNPQQDIKNV